MFPGENPLEHEVRPGRMGEWLTVVGVAANVKNNGLMQQNDPEYYVPRKRSPENAPYSATVILRSTGSLELVAQRVRAGIGALDPAVPVEIESLQQRIGRLSERPRLQALLLGMFAAVGLLLATIGLYGVVSYLVAQRTQEIGIRMALGATRSSITGLVLGRAAVWTAGGAAAGGVASIFAARLLQGMLFHVSALDPVAFASAAATLFIVAMAAAWAPSHRASRIDPMHALRRD
jgi:hypothetical protein